MGAGRSIRLKVAERIGAGIVVERVGRRSRMRVVACRTGVLSISRGQVEVQGATGDGMWVVRVVAQGSGLREERKCT